MTIDALAANLTAAESQRRIWYPDAFGSVCFLVASYLAMAAVSGSWRLRLRGPRRPGAQDRRAELVGVHRLRHLGRRRHRPGVGGGPRLRGRHRRHLRGRHLLLPWSPPHAPEGPAEVEAARLTSQTELVTLSVDCRRSVAPVWRDGPTPTELVTLSGDCRRSVSPVRRDGWGSVGLRWAAHALALPGAALGVEAAAAGAGRRPGRHPGPLDLQRLPQPGGQPVEGELAVSGLRPLVVGDDPHDRSQLLEQAGPLAGPSDGELATSKTTSARVLAVLACWPPGPPEALKRQSSSDSGMLQLRLTAKLRSGRARFGEGFVRGHREPTVSLVPLKHQRP